jgi:hypothetical protein
VILLNEDGSITERATPTNNNGFYLLPIYAKKNYVLTLKSKNSNYLFEPSQHEIKLKDRKDTAVETILSETNFSF